MEAWLATRAQRVWILRDRLLECLENREGKKESGLTQAARNARRRGALDDSRFKRAEKLDICYNVLRHLTEQRFEECLKEFGASNTIDNAKPAEVRASDTIDKDSLFEKEHIQNKEGIPTEDASKLKDTAKDSLYAQDPWAAAIEEQSASKIQDKEDTPSEKDREEKAWPSRASQLTDDRRLRGAAESAGPELASLREKIDFYENRGSLSVIAAAAAAAAASSSESAAASGGPSPVESLERTTGFNEASLQKLGIALLLEEPVSEFGNAAIDIKVVDYRWEIVIISIDGVTMTSVDRVGPEIAAALKMAMTRTSMLDCFQATTVLHIVSSDHRQRAKGESNGWLSHEFIAC